MTAEETMANRWDGIEFMVRDYLDGKIHEAEPRLAATVALVDDSGDGLQVFLMSRRSSMPFAPSQTVFPGGGVDPDDFDLGDFFDRRELDEWSRVLDCDVRTATAVVGAAIRETFEETGVLFARVDGALSELSLDQDRLDTLRNRLNAKEVRFVDVLDELSLTLDTAPLTAWSRWVTPVWSKRRYDTFIFVAGMLDGQTALDDSDEADAAAWYPVSGATRKYDRGELAMMTPTLETLRELGTYSLATIGTDARDLRPAGFSLDVDAEMVRVIATTPEKTTQVHQFLLETRVTPSP